MLSLLLAASLWQPIVFHGVPLAADLATTEWAEAQGAVERNAAYRGGGKYVLHAATGAILVSADIWAQKRGKKWLVWTLRAGSLLAWGRVALHNLHTGREAGR